MFNFEWRFTNMKALVKRFIKDESGMETLEWALVGALVVLGFVTIWTAFGPKLAAVFTDMGAELDSARGAGGG
jgi:Flp pilus assembly pilin Flp